MITFTLHSNPNACDALVAEVDAFGGGELRHEDLGCFPYVEVSNR